MSNLLKMRRTAPRALLRLSNLFGGQRRGRGCAAVGEHCKNMVRRLESTMSDDAARQRIQTLADESGRSLAYLSGVIGRNASYLQQYLKRGSPRVLPEMDRRLLAAYFDVDETELGAPERYRVSAAA